MPALAADTAAIDEFYKTVSAISATLLGLWWVVIQLKYRGRRDPTRLRHAYGVMLFFLLPGVMALLSGINSQLSLLWRLAFGFIGALGIAEVLLFALSAGVKTRGATALRWCGFVLYVLIVAFAIRPNLAMSLGLGLTPRELEAVFITMLLVVGMHMVWFALTEPDETAGA
jgi:hypothetical protein